MINKKVLFKLKVNHETITYSISAISMNCIHLGNSSLAMNSKFPPHGAEKSFYAMVYDRARGSVKIHESSPYYLLHAYAQTR